LVKNAGRRTRRQAVLLTPGATGPGGGARLAELAHGAVGQFAAQAAELHAGEGAEDAGLEEGRGAVAGRGGRAGLAVVAREELMLCGEVGDGDVGAVKVALAPGRAALANHGTFFR
jgi:hypothetical protein